MKSDFTIATKVSSIVTLFFFSNFTSYRLFPVFALIYSQIFFFTINNGEENSLAINQYSDHFHAINDNLEGFYQ